MEIEKKQTVRATTIINAILSFILVYFMSKGIKESEESEILVFGGLIMLAVFILNIMGSIFSYDEDIDDEKKSKTVMGSLVISLIFIGVPSIFIGFQISRYLGIIPLLYIGLNISAIVFTASIT